MKVSINHTVEMSTEQRIQLADVLDGKTSKRQASRNEAKDFVWEHGSCWEEELKERHEYTSGTPESDDEDLLGGDTAGEPGPEDDEEDLI